MSARRTAVVGSGASGLAAAAHLAARGADVTLFEAGETVGGQLRTIRRDGWLIDAGAQLVSEPPPEVRALLDAAGLAAETIRASPAARRRYVVHDGKPQPIPATLGDLISSPLLSIGGRLRMAREPFVPVREDEAGETVDAFARRRFGEEVAERLFDSLVAEMSGGDSASSLVDYLFPRLVQFERSTGSVLKGQMRAGMEQRRRNKGKATGGWNCVAGLGRVASALATREGVHCRTGACVTAVDLTAQTYRLTGEGFNETFDALVLAVPSVALGRVSAPTSWHPALEAIGSIPTAPVISVSLGYARGQVAHPLDGLSIRVPSHERRPLLTIFVPSAVFPGRAPDGHVLLTALAGGVHHPGLGTMSDAEIIALVRAELAELVGASGNPVISHLTRWPDGIPQAVAGHSERLEQATTLEENVPRLALTGAWRDGLSVSEAMRGGMRAADRVAAALGIPPAQ